jgi:hypothetical protein
MGMSKYKHNTGCYSFRPLLPLSGHLLIQDDGTFKVADHNGVAVYQSDDDPREWLDEAGINYDFKMYPTSGMVWLVLESISDVQLFNEILAIRIMAGL